MNTHYSFESNTKWLYCGALGLVLLSAAPAAFAYDTCPDISIINTLPLSNITATITRSTSIGPSATTNDTATYSVSSMTETPSGTGVPGIMQMCIYPIDPPSLPNPPNATASFGSWVGQFPVEQGFFDFSRNSGNDSDNIPLDGTANVTVGSATWTGGAAPTQQNIVVELNDTNQCTSTNPCFVQAASAVEPLCNGNPACREVTITEEDINNPESVQVGTKLHIHYQYVIVNNLGGPNMYFNVPGNRTQDINAGGAKDLYGCEQIPDPSGNPAMLGSSPYPNYPVYAGTETPVSNMNLNLFTQKTTYCNQSRFNLTAGGSQVTLSPGQAMTFVVDMITRKDPKTNSQQFNSCGRKLLTSGFTVKWFQSNDGGKTMHSYTAAPAYVNVECGGG